MKVIYEGKLNNDGQPFKVQTLSMADMKQILSLQEVVIESLESKETLQPLSAKEFQYILEGNGLMIGAFAEEQLIAFRALLVPPIDEEHLGLDIGLTKEELPGVIYQEISNVHPDYRGNRLQKTLATLIMQELQKHNESYSYVCCTVAPFNIPSLKDKFAQGMEIAALKEKYGRRLRYIFVKELAEAKTKDWLQIVTVRMDDMAGQQDLLEKGWRGFQMDNREGVLWVDFGKKA
ncbi:GNAT family N-acetyltransferase [Bacillus aerolatus]|uniref:GNAT family N-acetyltransferase n=1 Tax=Bacillus aerolatus TaxID=2653354 RepID=A0A6I1FNC7_9BACI|nr:GNAT family N-acetyltransferase [Bacillus aerolatus]KAB7705555.1 GNAT family N-acetyltransferase [Bacillus aerolatus]